ncbi:Holliday junction branch migration protein RuvA [Limnochorda pilosa]|uniref:Holliday junction branch migration complex subunit RuvA n=1 Tax=Limnochorda pilosa TaxID=1555112 RepID=A0A0K2SMG0_LIMPI|nr:Holliday junction branch migration protein RuvA [Limnochorda pilosa]BAS28318.1 Holliday junction ATP-dependent DNA helicase RuvA [Limnochorda pilosa]
MIRRLRGRLAAVDAGELVVDAGGVGYQVFCTTSDLARLPRLGETVELEVHTLLREDALQLYGFLEDRDRRHFLRLLQVSGVGPRMALQILSALPGDRLVEAVRSGDVQQLVRVPGIGKKTAQRLLLELAGAFDRELPAAAAAWPGGLAGPVREAEEALMTLGYREAEARDAVERALAVWREERAPRTSGREGETATAGGSPGTGAAGDGAALPPVADLIRRALKLMGSERHGA